MKYILVFTLLCSFAYSDEIKKIESIIKDITELRQQHEVCQKELYLTKNKQVKHKHPNKDEKYNQSIKKLKNQINKYKKIVKTKDKEIKKLKNSIYKQEKFDKPNKFPNLILKQQYINYITTTIKPATYRLKTNTKIYNKINGKTIESWKKGVSFTTNIKATFQKKDSWFRITGFFINEIWVKSQSQMWIKTKYTYKR